MADDDSHKHYDRKRMNALDLFESMISNSNLKPPSSIICLVSCAQYWAPACLCFISLPDFSRSWILNIIPQHDIIALRRWFQASGSTSHVLVIQYDISTLSSDKVRPSVPQDPIPFFRLLANVFMAFYLGQLEIDFWRRDCRVNGRPTRCQVRTFKK